MELSAFLKSSGLALAFSLGQLAQSQGPVVVRSPDSHIQAELSSQNGNLSYRILVDGQEILAPSPLGIRADNVELGEQVTLGTAERHNARGSFPLYGTHTLAKIDAEEASVPVTAHGETYHVDLHMANDGFGVRLRLDARSGRHVQADRSAWTLTGDPEMWVEAWDPGYENFYHASPLTGLDGTPLGLPLTAHMGSLYVTLSEAALKDYGDLAVAPEGMGRLQGKLLNDPDGWTTSDAVVQPWRVTIIARDLTALVNSTLIPELNPAPESDMVNASWVKPGRSTWQWLSSGAPIESEQHRWVDWTQQLGIEYYLVDEGWADWKTPWPSLTETAAYGKQHHVNTWIWAHSNEVKDPAQREEYFRKAVSAGVVGVKIDFPPPTNRWWANWYWDTARDAAKYHLMVDFHGATKPTGMDRTWPNVLTREGIRGHEYHITRYQRKLTPEHDTILPFTRYVAGPGDYTPTVFEVKELQGNTWAHELAQAIVFTSPFLCYGGNPQDYLANPAKDILEAIPAVWDETRVLPASDPGKIAAFARRSGKRWFIGVINGGSTADVTLPLSFLGNGTWKAQELFDQPGKPDAWDRKSQQVSGTDSIALHLTPRGGFVAEITR